MTEPYKLHVVIDPLCSWCYAASPLLDVGRELLPVAIHAGGLMIGERRRQVSPEFREMVLSNITRVSQQSGQVFGSAFTDELLTNNELLLDSTPPIAAIMAVQTLGGDSVQMLHDLQIAYYQQGKFLSDTANLTHVAAQQGIEKAAFDTAFATALPHVEQHITDSRKYLAKVGSKSFPSFILQTASDSFVQIPHEEFYGNPKAWKTHLLTLI